MHRARERASAALVFALGAALSGCEASDPSAGAADAAPELLLAVPDTVLQSRAVDIDNLEPEVRIDGTPLQAERSGGTWRVTAVVPPNARVPLELTWYERLDGVRLPLATLSDSIGPFADDAAVTVERSDYVSAPFDFDRDGVSNLDERIEGTDPIEVDVVVPAIEEGLGAPNADGFRGEVWDRAVATDRSGEPLAIDNLVIGGERAEAADGEVPYRWYVMHDGERLYLYVEFEPPGTDTVEGDSPRFFDDDVVNLFFDGDLSRGERLEGRDGGDDRYFYIRQAVRAGEERALARAPFESAPELPPSLGYGVTPLGWEISVALADLNVRVGEPFGFDVHIDQDLDGGEREARWAWAYPRREFEAPFERSVLNGTVLLGD